MIEYYLLYPDSFPKSTMFEKFLEKKGASKDASPSYERVSHDEDGSSSDTLMSHPHWRLRGKTSSLRHYASIGYLYLLHILLLSAYLVLAIHYLFPGKQQDKRHVEGFFSEYRLVYFPHIISL